MTPQSLILDPKNWEVIKEQAQILVKSGFLPPSIKTIEQAIAIALKGFELGLPIMTSYSHINIISGKPTVSAELMLALIYKHCHGSIINFLKIEDDICVIEAKRPGGKTHTFKYDSDDARAAGLLGRQQWKQYPRAMMRSRCVSEMARSLFPDAIMGCSYTPDEISADAPNYIPDEIQPVMIPVEEEPPPPNIMSLVKPKSEEPKKTFDSSNPKHVEKLYSMLKSKNISDEHWQPISEKMHGKSSNALDNVVDEYYNELFSSAFAPNTEEEQQESDLSESEASN